MDGPDEPEGLERLAKAAELPPLPEADAAGNVPAVAFARATLARGIIRDRARAGLSQAELAKRARIRKETLCRIERGRHTPSVATVQRIDKALKAALANTEVSTTTLRSQLPPPPEPRQGRSSVAQGAAKQALGRGLRATQPRQGRA